MCNHHVAETVRERIKKEGLPSVSRRNFLKMGSVLTAGAALAPRVVRADMHTKGVIDLTHAFTTDFPVFPGGPQAERETLVSVENDGYYIQRWVFAEHTGTHMDFPGHFIADGLRTDTYPVELLLGPAVVIDISARAEDDADTMVTVDDLKGWEMENGDIPVGAFVMMYSGWEELIGSPAFLGDDSGLHFPGFSAEASEWLVGERSIHGIGVDTLSIDHGPSMTFDTHYIILGAGLLGIENVANLTSIMGAEATVVCGIPRYEEGSGGPARILALTGM